MSPYWLGTLQKYAQPSKRHSPTCITNKRKIIIICPKHGEFLQIPNSHLTQRGCPKCKSSIGELKILHYLKKNNVVHEYQKTFDDCKNPKTNWKLRFDFYIPSKNLLVEYDGPQHFSTARMGKYKYSIKDLKYTKYKDIVKTDYAISKQIKLLRIKFTEQHNIENILNQNL